MKEKEIFTFVKFKNLESMNIDLKNNTLLAQMNPGVNKFFYFLVTKEFNPLPDSSSNKENQKALVQVFDKYLVFQTYLPFSKHIRQLLQRIVHKKFEVRMKLIEKMSSKVSL